MYRETTLDPKIQAEIRPSAKKVKLKVDVLPKKCDRESTFGRKSRFNRKATLSRNFWLGNQGFAKNPELTNCRLDTYIWIESSKPLSFLSRFKNLEFVFRTECMIWTNENYFSNFKFWCHLIPTYIYLEHITTIFLESLMLFLWRWAVILYKLCLSVDLNH